MSKMTIELCPETGICTLLKEGAGKVDLVPDEVAGLRAAADAEAARALLAEVDDGFAGKLEVADLDEIRARLA